MIVKYFIDKGIVLSRTPEGPLALHIGPFAASLREQGYAMVSIHRQVLLAACFSRWLQKRAVSLRSITSDHPARYLRYRMRKVQRGRGDTAALGHLLAFLHRERVIPAERIPSRRLTSAERCAQAYEHYLRETRGLAKSVSKKSKTKDWTNVSRRVMNLRVPNSSALGSLGLGNLHGQS